MKHKVWSKKFNCWMDKDFFDKHYESGRVPDTFINSEGLLVFVYSGFSTHIVSPDEYVIVWSTGLKDRNGKEIYEGDILKDHSGVGEVEWVQEHCAFRVFVKDPDFGNMYMVLESDGQMKNTEVIGNRWDNPDLLEGGYE